MVPSNICKGLLLANVAFFHTNVQFLKSCCFFKGKYHEIWLAISLACISSALFVTADKVLTNNYLIKRHLKNYQTISIIIPLHLLCQ